MRPIFEFRKQSFCLWTVYQMNDEGLFLPSGPSSSYWTLWGAKRDVKNYLKEEKKEAGKARKYKWDGERQRLEKIKRKRGK